MQTQLADWIKDSPRGLEADAILRKCVHCGFCLATCPTYNVLGDELDSPRGRIYLMKQMLEGSPVTERTQLHLDRCLTCRACETTCPSGVEYGRLADIGRRLVEEKVARPQSDRIRRRFLNYVIPRRALFATALAVGRTLRPLLPGALARRIPRWRPEGERPEVRHERRMIILDGCVQPAIAPSIDAAAARVLDRAGISLVRAPRAGCCGAVTFHLNYQDESLAYVKANIDAWWPLIEAGAEAIIITASGCGTMVKEYGHLLQRDPQYAAKAARVSALAKDLSQVVAAQHAQLAPLVASRGGGKRVAFHSPCSLQHGLGINGVVEPILRDAGFTLTAVPDGHQCCGSSGTYSLLNPEMSQRLRESRVAALESGAPAVIATANIGCLAHISGGAGVPVRHWIEVLDEAMSQAPRA
jgi:glycolate oxidase iron-sulfur subunit